MTLPFEHLPICDDVLGEALQLAPKGYFVEFGVADGSSLRRLADTNYGQVIGLDTFTGLPEHWRNGFPAGSFSQDGKIPSIEGTVCLKGLFSETIPILNAVPCALCHIDCDLYQGAKEALEWFRDHHIKGAIVVFDEIYGYPGYQDHEWRAYQEVVTWPHEWILRSHPDCNKAAFRCL